MKSVLHFKILIFPRNSSCWRSTFICLSFDFYRYKFNKDLWCYCIIADDNLVPNFINVRRFFLAFLDCNPAGTRSFMYIYSKRLYDENKSALEFFKKVKPTTQERDDFLHSLYYTRSKTVPTNIMSRTR